MRDTQVDGEAVVSPGAKRIVVIHNPAAGWIRRNRLARLLAGLRRQGHAVELRHTARPGDASAIAAAIGPDDADLVVAAGGDGTINEVVNGLAGRAMPVAILPLGTANVLAWEMGFAGRADRAVEAVLGGAAQPIRPGLVEGRRFLLMASAGIDSRVVAGAGPGMKRVLGKAAFVLAAIREILRKQSAPVTGIADGRRIEADLVVVTRAAHYGGPFVIAPDASLADPTLWVVAPRRRGRLALVRYGLALVAGRLAALEDVDVFPAREVVLEGPAGHPVQVDGDAVGTLPVRITCDTVEIGLIWPDRKADR